MARTKKKKSAKRVAAGKRAWAKLSANEKAKRIRALTGRAPAGKSSSSGGNRVANNKNNNRQKKQGIASWATSIMALIIGFSSDAARAIEASYAPKGSRMARFAELEFSDYLGYYPAFTGIDGDPHWVPKNLVRGWGSKGAGIAFKKSASYLVKVAPVKSLIPRLT